MQTGRVALAGGPPTSRTRVCNSRNEGTRNSILVALQRCCSVYARRRDIVTVPGVGIRSAAGASATGSLGVDGVPP
jgi:hypothetical protein